MKDYFLGGSPIWELCRVAYRLTKPPVVGGGIALLLGYSWAAMKRVERPVTPELMRFHRREQMARLRTIIRSLMRLKTGEVLRRRGQRGRTYTGTERQRVTAVRASPLCASVAKNQESA